MLEIEIDLGRIAASQARYREQGTVESVGIAWRVMKLRKAMSHLAANFNKHQKSAGRSHAVLENGKQQTILNSVLDARGPLSWPARSAAILHGLQLPAPPLMPDEPCCAGGPNFSDIDEDSYLARLDFGAPQDGHLSNLTSVALYFAPLKKLIIVWVGAVDDIDEAIEDLRVATKNWTQWQGVSTQYADWIGEACKDRMNEES